MLLQFGLPPSRPLCILQLITSQRTPRLRLPAPTVTMQTLPSGSSRQQTLHTAHPARHVTAGVMPPATNPASHPVAGYSSRGKSADKKIISSKFSSNSRIVPAPDLFPAGATGVPAPRDRESQKRSRTQMPSLQRLSTPHRTPSISSGIYESTGRSAASIAIILPRNSFSDMQCRRRDRRANARISRHVAQEIPSAQASGV